MDAITDKILYFVKFIKLLSEDSIPSLFELEKKIGVGCSIIQASLKILNLIEVIIKIAHSSRAFALNINKVDILQSLIFLLTLKEVMFGKLYEVRQ